MTSRSKPTPRTRTSVAHAYAPQPLGDILSKIAPESDVVVPPERTVPAEEVTAPLDAGTPQREPVPTTARKKSKPHVSGTRGGGAGPTHARAPLNVRIPDSTLDKIDHYRALTAQTTDGKQPPYITVLLQALSEMREDLTRLVQEDSLRRDAKLAAAPSTDGGLFIQSGHRSTSLYDEPTTTHVWRTYPQNVDQINELVESTGARDRNQLLVVALVEFLKRRGS